MSTMLRAALTGTVARATAARSTVAVARPALSKLCFLICIVRREEISTDTASSELLLG